MFSSPQYTHYQASSIPISGHLIYYQMAGNKSGPPLVFLHGFGTSRLIWHFLLPHLLPHYQVVLVDIPGFGRSSCKGRWRLTSVVEALSQWLDTLHLSPITLVGHSMGGAVAIRLAAMQPASIQHLILISPAGLPLEATIPTLALRSLHSNLQKGNGRYPPGLLLSILRPRMFVLWHCAEEMTRSDIREDFIHLTMPILLIWGEQDVMLPIKYGRLLHSALPQAQFVTLPQCGHRPMLAQPATLADIMHTFLQNTIF